MTKYSAPFLGLGLLLASACAGEIVDEAAGESLTLAQAEQALTGGGGDLVLIGCPTRFTQSMSDDGYVLSETGLVGEFGFPYDGGYFVSRARVMGGLYCESASGDTILAQQRMTVALGGVQVTGAGCTAINDSEQQVYGFLCRIPLGASE
jgi:hypothetical protein